MQLRVLLAQMDQVCREADQVLVGTLPVQPADGVVLVVGVVVALLGAAHLIAGSQHRRALRQQQRGQQGPFQACAGAVDVRVVCRAFLPGIPAVVVVVAVAVVLAVGLVVLLVVGNQIVQREAVVRGDEVDAGLRAATVVVELLAGAGNLAGEGAAVLVGLQPEAAHRVTEAVVPLAPARQIGAQLVAAAGRVPGLGDQLDASQGRILPDGLEEGGVAVEAARIVGIGQRHAPQHRGKVEAEAVDVHLLDPVAQRIHDHLQRHVVAGVDAVAGAGVVGVVGRILAAEVVVGLVVQPAPRQRGAALVAFGRVVVHHVQDHLDAVAVQLLHHLPELVDRILACKAPVRREEGQRVVAPVVAQPHLDQRAFADGFLHGQQFHGRHAEALQVGDGGRTGHAFIGAAQLGRHVGVRLGEALDVRLVDDAFAHRDVRAVVALPVELVHAGDHGLGHVGGVVIHLGVRTIQMGLMPLELAVQAPGVGVQQQAGRVVAQSARWVVGAVHAIAVDQSCAGIRQEAVPDVVHRAVHRMALDLVAVGVEHAQRDAACTTAEKGKVDATVVTGGTQWPHPALGQFFVFHGSFKSSHAMACLPRQMAGW